MNCYVQGTILGARNIAVDKKEFFAFMKIIFFGGRKGNVHPHTHTYTHANAHRYV